MSYTSEDLKRLTRFHRGEVSESSPLSLATISECGKYRYDLLRIWDMEGPLLNWVMLNPSTADADSDDPTVRRCIGFAKEWLFGGMVVTNLFAYRATNPRELSTVEDPIGPANDRYLSEAAGAARLTICAWGNHGAKFGRAASALEVLLKAAPCLRVLGVTQKGQPCHPLYLPARTRPSTWSVQEVASRG